MVESAKTLTILLHVKNSHFKASSRVLMHTRYHEVCVSLMISWWWYKHGHKQYGKLMKTDMYDSTMFVLLWIRKANKWHWRYTGTPSGKPVVQWDSELHKMSVHTEKSHVLSTRCTQLITQCKRHRVAGSQLSNHSHYSFHTQHTNHGRSKVWYTMDNGKRR